MATKAVFKTEADLCRAFIAQLPEGWTVYPETAEFDILLVRSEDGFQIGVEAKLTLNTKVVAQVSEQYWNCTRAGPDCRAVLVPWGTAGSLTHICKLLGITVLEMRDEATKQHYYRDQYFTPALPVLGKQRRHDEDWHEHMPSTRCKLPDYVPDVGAGHAGPTKLTAWKVLAIKIAILVELRGYVTRDDFKHLKLDHRRWLLPAYGWLKASDVRGRYIGGPRIGDFKAQHPVNYEQIKADLPKWNPTPFTASVAISGE